MEQQKEKILFIGLGNMGYPMACNLLKNGFSVKGFDVSPNQRTSFEKEGGQWVESLEESATACDIVISMLPGGAEVKNLYTGPQNLFAFLKENTLIIDCTTADPEEIREVAQESQKHSLKMIDAPVSGGNFWSHSRHADFYCGRL